MSSRRRASGDRITPNSDASNEAHLVAGSPSKKKPRTLLTYHPALEVVTATIDPDFDTYNETELGKFEVLQTVDSNGQGYYLHCKNMRLRGYFGPVLLKYLGGRNEITRQLRYYSNLEPAVAAAVQLAADFNNPAREILFSGQLVHANIVKVLGFVAPNGRREEINAIIMEGNFNDGSLDAYASCNQIPLLLVKAFALQLASALEYCHSLDVMHRDVRTRNIYVQDGMRVKLGNFGYARAGDQGNIYTANKGEELYYRAPEMISDHATTEYTVSVDVYGFALVLWSMLHDGEKPYKDDPELERLVRNENRFKQHLVAGNRPRIDDIVDQGLASLIEKCWINETEADKRPPMSEVVEALQYM